MAVGSPIPQKVTEGPRQEALSSIARLDLDLQRRREAYVPIAPGHTASMPSSKSVSNPDRTRTGPCRRGRGRTGSCRRTSGLPPAPGPRWTPRPRAVLGRGSPDTRRPGDRECFRRVNSGGECGAPRGQGGGNGGIHGFRGASGGVPARGPGFPPDLCPPRAPLAPCFSPSSGNTPVGLGHLSGVETVVGVRKRWGVGAGGSALSGPIPVPERSPTVADRLRPCHRPSRVAEVRC